MERYDWEDASLDRILGRMTAPLAAADYSGAASSFARLTQGGGTMPFLPEIGVMNPISYEAGQRQVDPLDNPTGPPQRGAAVAPRWEGGFTSLLPSGVGQGISTSLAGLFFRGARDGSPTGFGIRPGSSLTEVFGGTDLSRMLPDLVRQRGTYGDPGDIVQSAISRLLNRGFDAQPSDPGQSGGGNLSAPGGAWATLDAMNPQIADAAAKTGVPANLIKAMLAREGSFGRDHNVVALRGEYVYAFNGIFQSTARDRGIDWNRMITDRGYAIWAMGEVLRQIKAEQGFTSWADVAAYYFAGPNWNNPNWGDETGENTTWNYVHGPTGVITRMNWLDQQGGGTGGGGTVSGNQIVQLAQQYVGVRYVWGSIPGENQDPWQTGWDCSGLVWYLDQKYGSGQIPQGSHYQYQWAQNTGRLVSNPSQLQPGDLVFFDTGIRGGGGDGLNRASHVAVYLGNGKMLNAANADTGTVISDLNAYLAAYPFLGGARLDWSGGTPGTGSGGGGSTASRLWWY